MIKFHPSLSFCLSFLIILLYSGFAESRTPEETSFREKPSLDHPVDENAISGDVNSDEPGIDDYLSDLEGRPFHSSLTASGASRRAYKGYKPKDFDLKSLLARAKKLKRNLKRDPASSHPYSAEISSAEGLTNFQKVSRIHQSRRHLFLQ